MNNSMNDKHQELLESICLKTIDEMFHAKNINVLTIIKEANNKKLFFPEFYEMMFMKMTTQYGYDNILKIVINYEEFGLESYKASTIFNDSIKHMDIQTYFGYGMAENFLKRLNEHNIFLDLHNMKKIESKIENNVQEELIANNDKIKSYMKMNNKLPLKGITSTTRKI